MIAIPNMEKPKRCIEELGGGLLDNPCLFVDERAACLLQEDSKIGEYEENYKTCPLIEIDLVRCEECEWSNGECSVGERYQGSCTFGKRRTDETIESITFKKMVKAVKEEMREVQNFAERRNDGAVCSYGVPANADQHTQRVEGVGERRKTDETI